MPSNTILMPDHLSLKGSPYEQALNRLNTMKIDVLKKELERRGSRLKVSDPAVDSYLNDFDPSLPDITIFIKHPELKRFISDMDSLVLAESAPAVDDEGFDEAVEEETAAFNRNAGAGIRALYLTEELTSDELGAGVNGFLYDLMTAVIFNAGEVGFELPDAWTEPFPREKISRLLCDGHENSVTYKGAFVARSEVSGEEIAATIARGVLNTMDKLNIKLLEELTSQFPNPSDFALEYLDVSEMLKLKRAQLRAQSLI